MNYTVFTQFKERTPDHLTVYTDKMLVDREKREKRVIHSLSALVSLQSMSSRNRADILYETLIRLFRHTETAVLFLWIPTHRGIEGN